MTPQNRMRTASILVALSWAVQAAATPQHWPLTFTEPYLVAPEPSTSMYVIWLTAEPAHGSYVELGRNTGYGRIVEAVTHEITGMRQWDQTTDSYPVPLRVYQQVARIDRLEPDTRYYYRVVTHASYGKAVGAGYDFRTAPEHGPVKFVLLSDLQLKTQAPATLRLVGKQGADFFLYNGDLENTPYKADEWFRTPGAARNPEGLRWFEMMQQTAEGARLLQYTPIYPTPGNHEVDGQERLSKKGLLDLDQLGLGVYLQLFRPLYPEQEYYRGGRHWYSVDYGDMHVSSLSLFRSYGWSASEAPGWPLFDGIGQQSSQYRWLGQDLARARRSGRYRWAIQHWHMFNRRDDVATPFTDPVIPPGQPDAATYPGPDQLLTGLKPLYEAYGVNGVSFGHSHVYERYLVDGVNYIEAASIGSNYWTQADPDSSPNLGLAPVFAENCFRSFLVVTADRSRGLLGEAVVASEPDLQASLWPAERIQACQDHLRSVSHGYSVGAVFDRFQLAGPRPRSWRSEER